MDEVSLDNYNKIRSGSTGFYEQKRGLISVWGSEAVQFLDGLITNDVKILEDGAQMLAAFPNAQGRLLAVARVLRQGEKFLFDTEEATREKVFNNLFRFTYAGDFFVEDISEQFRYFELFGDNGSESKVVATGIPSSPPYEGGVGAFRERGGSLLFISSFSTDYFVPTDSAATFISELLGSGATEISDDLYEVLRIENGVPKYGVDMDETTIVPELGIEGLISYNKGCYIGQEIIARIHFRGHVAKKLTGLLLSEPPARAGGLTREIEVSSHDGKNAGRITSATFSPKLDRNVALGLVRYDYLAEGTVLRILKSMAKVKALPIV